MSGPITRREVCNEFPQSLKDNRDCTCGSLLCVAVSSVLCSDAEGSRMGDFVIRTSTGESGSVQVQATGETLVLLGELFLTNCVRTLPEVTQYSTIQWLSSLHVSMHCFWLQLL